MKFLKFASLALLFLCVFSCQKTIQPENLQKLNGYWEIEKAVGKDGTTKVYKINTTVDFIELKNDLTGNRRKVKPIIGGTYETNGHEEFINLIKENKNFIIHYKNDQSEWDEILLSIDENHFSTQNKNTETTFYYKRYEPITIE